LNGNPINTSAWVPVVAGACDSGPIQLHPPARNQVLLKVCKTVGDWYFTARVTDAQGKDLPTSPSCRRLPEPAIAGAPAVPTQQVDGFAAPVRSSRYSELYSDYRGNAAPGGRRSRTAAARSWWTTDPAPAKAPTVFDFTAAMSEPARHGRAVGERPLRAQLPDRALSHSATLGARPVRARVPRRRSRALPVGAWALAGAGRRRHRRAAGRAARSPHQDGSPFRVLPDQGARRHRRRPEQLTLESRPRLAGPRRAAPPAGSVAPAPGA
jgi:hypothetical protein